MDRRVLYGVFLCFLMISCSEIENARNQDKYATDIINIVLKNGEKKYTPFLIRNDTFHIQVPNELDLVNVSVSVNHTGEKLFVDGIEKGNELVDNLSNFCTLHCYTVSGGGKSKDYFLQLYNLPIVSINSPESVSVESRYEWLSNCSFTIRNSNGITEDYGEANVKGRGNWSWRVGLKNGKKPYAVKLANKPKNRTLLGMPGHKRWVLLANPVDYLPNPIGFEITRRATNKWAPRCRFVELFLNGNHQGLYLLCEQIKIDKNRINIKELKKTDVEGDAVTGGYLISYDNAEEDDDPIYYSDYYRMPVLIKNPDTDDIIPEQQTYILSFINQMEESLYNDDKFANRDYLKYMDIDSWIDFYLVNELWGAYELYKPRSVWMYKDRNGKMIAGPGWDFEENYFSTQKWICNNVFYFKRLFQDPRFVSRIKEKWKSFSESVIGGNDNLDIEQYVDSLYETIKYSAQRDRFMVPSEHNYYLPDSVSTLDLEYRVIKGGIKKKIDWMGNQISLW